MKNCSRDYDVLSPVVEAAVEAGIHVNGDHSAVRMIHRLAAAWRLVVAARTYNEKLVVQQVVDLKQMR